MPKDKRREMRHRMGLPVRVLGHEPDGRGWQELAETGDVSSAGLSFDVPRPVFRGQVLRLKLPMPSRLRRFDAEEPAYHVYAVVRDATLQEGTCRVGVMFYGKEPPRGFEDNPGARYVLPSDVEEESAGAAVAPAREAVAPQRAREVEAEDPEGRRSSARYDIFVDFTVERTDEFGAVLSSERTVAENVSRGGARLLTAGSFSPGEVVALHEVSGPFEARAEIRELRVGPDGICRLHVRFLDGRSPDHLVRPR
ncbi:MAG: PilZ domain-containing protein [Acidobacteria bacterium]|nr:PilZ domain-containing protein [Acidobacteriota bacterium]